MYGTIARFQVQPGRAEGLLELTQRWSDELQIPGFVTEYLYRMDTDPNIFYLVVLFDSKASYFANANSPEQAARYQEVLAATVGEPVWHDGEIVFAHTAEQVSHGL